MKRRWLIVIPIILALLLVCAATAATLLFTLRQVDFSSIRLPMARSLDFSAEEQIDQSFAVDGPARLVVENLSGPVRVEAGPDGEISVQGKKTARGVNQSQAEENLQRLDVNLTQDGQTVRVKVEVDGSRSNTWDGSVDFTIVVPEQTAVEVTTTFGELALTGTRGDAELNTSFGAVEVHDVGAGSLTVHTTNGRVEADGIQADQADIDLKSEFGDINLGRAIAGRVTLQTTNGAIVLNDVEAGGAVDLSSDFGSIEFRAGSAEALTIKTLNGNITLEDLDLTGRLAAQSNFGGLNLNNAAADGYELKTQSGSVRVDGASGELKAASEFGEIEIRNAVEVTADLTSGNGPIRFTGSLGDGPHTIRSNFGAILLSLPEESGFDIDLKTDFGKITSEFDISIQGTLDEEHWVGKINEGGPQLNVSTQNGNITLEVNHQD